MIEGAGGEIYSFHPFKIKRLIYLDNILITEPEQFIEPHKESEPIVKLREGYIRLKSYMNCYVYSYFFINSSKRIDHSKLIEESEELKIKWFKVEYVGLNEKEELYNIIPITSNHEITELEIL